VKDFNVELVFALPDRQTLLSIPVHAGHKVADAIRISGIEALFPESDIDRLAVGIWGEEVSRDRVLREGDRVEIYRPLEIDPMEARRRLALAGQTMRSIEEVDGSD